MPLPPLPDNNTDRYWLKYTSAGEEHELCFRLANSTSTADGEAAATALANALKSWMPSTDTFSSLRKAENGSNLSFPVTFTPIAGTGAGAAEATDLARFCSIVGRSAGGYRCRMTFFTPNISDSIAYRTATGVSTPGSSLYTAAAAQSPAFVAKDGFGVIWNGYSNNGFNSYWQRQLR